MCLLNQIQVFVCPFKPVPCDLQAWAKGESYEACIEAAAGPDDGTVLRAPTEKQGLIPLCQDTFLGKVAMQIICAYPCIPPHPRLHHLMLCMSTCRLICYMDRGSLLTVLKHQWMSCPASTAYVQVRLQLWRLDKHGQREGGPVLDTSSTTGALETGGGPWPATWKAQAKMQQPLKSIVQIPIDVRGIAEALPGDLLPPGL